MSTQEPLPDVKLRLSRTYVKCYHIINAQTGKKKNAAFEHVNFGRQLANLRLEQNVNTLPHKKRQLSTFCQSALLKDVAN